MAEKFPAIRDGDVILVLKKLGFTLWRQTKGSHEVWRHADGRHTIVPRHRGRTIKRRTLKSIIVDLGLTVKEFNRLLKD